MADPVRQIRDVTGMGTSLSYVTASASTRTDLERDGTGVRFTKNAPGTVWVPHRNEDPALSDTMITYSF